MLYVLTYDYVPDVLEKRTPHRAGHLALIQELHGAGKILYAGALAWKMKSAPSVGGSKAPA